MDVLLLVVVIAVVWAALAAAVALVVGRVIRRRDNDPRNNDYPHDSLDWDADLRALTTRLRVNGATHIA